MNKRVRQMSTSNGNDTTDSIALRLHRIGRKVLSVQVHHVERRRRLRRLVAVSLDARRLDLQHVLKSVAQHPPLADVIKRVDTWRHIQNEASMQHKQHSGPNPSHGSWRIEKQTATNQLSINKATLYRMNNTLKSEERRAVARWQTTTQPQRF